MLLGVIADDLTGATDVALMLTAAGMRTLQVMDAPTSDTPLEGYEAVVVALKSRTNPADEAIRWSLTALDALQMRGAKQILFKYCSTFDSTPAGNIGPVADALMARLGAELAIVCPAFPKNGRTIYKGNLFVGDLPLDESPMKDHPLTPMRDASLVRLMQAQTGHKVGLIPHQIVDQGRTAIAAEFAALRASGHRYVVTDAIRDRDLVEIGFAADGMALITGGSGIAMGLPEVFRQNKLLSADRSAHAFVAPLGRQAVLAGSCSAATRGQIAHAKAAGLPHLEINARDVLSGATTAASVLTWLDGQQATSTPLVYSSADPAVVAEIQAEFGRDRAGHAVEQLMSALAIGLKARGFSRLVVAGGETSGAVVQGLGIKALEIGPKIAPGVPWTRTRGDKPMALALKSGNFGGPDFFTAAFAMLSPT